MSKTAQARSLDVVILAAGASSRLGRPKQHVVLNGKSQLHRMLELSYTFLKQLNQAHRPFLVSGAYLKEDCEALASLEQYQPAHLYNKDWQQGMATSLACATEHTDADGLLVLLVDQYRLSLDDLNKIHSTYLLSPQTPVASSFNQTVGPPVIWPRSYWTAPDAKERHGDHLNKPPARYLLNKQRLLASSPQCVAVPSAQFDLDSEDDVTTALQFFRSNQST